MLELLIGLTAALGSMALGVSLFVLAPRQLWGAPRRAPAARGGRLSPSEEAPVP